MKILETLEALNEWQERVEKASLGFVLTMGALHDGHLALVKEAKNYSEHIIVSIFVNPTQFAEGEDLDNYPKTLEADIQKLEEMNIDALWLPQVSDIYPNGLEVDVKLGGITQVLEGEYRPHFFDGVATVVKRLLEHVNPAYAFLGEKDFQQLQVVRKLVSTFNMPVKIIGVPTVRDENGLALSSRNAYLSDAELKTAKKLNVILQKFAQSELNEKEAAQALLTSGFEKVDYITARNSETFQRDNPDRALVAAWINGTRLIDNMSFLHSKE